MIAQESQRALTPAGTLIVSIVLGAMAVVQVVATTLILVFGRNLPQFPQAASQLSAFDLAAIYLLAGVLAIATKNLIQKRRAAFSWFLAYVGLSSWLLLFYSLASSREPHFDEVVSLFGLLGAVAVLSYLFKLKINGALR